MTDLDALKAALEKVTPGEWKRVGPQKLTIRWGQGIENTTAGGKIGAMHWRNGPENAAAIVLAVNTLRQPGALELLALLNGPDEATVERVARAMACCVIDDGEGNQLRLIELLDFSGENKARVVVDQLARAALAALKEAK